MGVVARTIKLFSLPANVQGLLVNHVYVVEEGEIVVRIRVLVVQKDALLQVLHGVLVVSNFEVGQSKVVVQLGVVLKDLLRFFKGSDGIHVVAHFVHRDPMVEERLPRRSVFLF